MKKHVWMVVLCALLVPPVLFAQEPEKPRLKAEGDKHQQMALRREKMETDAHEAAIDREQRKAEMEMEQRKSEMLFQREMRKLELEKKNLELERERQALKKRGQHHPCKEEKCCGLFLIVCLVVNILLAVWVYRDIRKRNAGSGVWIVLALLTGFFGALLYALVRLGDSRSDK